MAKHLCAKRSFSGLTVFLVDAYLEEKMKGALPAPLPIHLLVNVGRAWRCYGGLARRISVIITVDFVGSQLQTQLDPHRLLGSVPVGAWPGGDAGLKGKGTTVWGTAPLSAAPGHAGSHLKNRQKFCVC